MKTLRDYISKIDVCEPNFQYIAKSGKINGSLLISLEKAMQEYATACIKADRERVAEAARLHVDDNHLEVDKQSILTLPIELI